MKISKLSASWMNQADMGLGAEDENLRAEKKQASNHYKEKMINKNTKRNILAIAAVALLLESFSVIAAPNYLSIDAIIRKNLSERIPGLPKIDEIRPSGFPGMFEIRVGSDIAYTDPKGEYLIRGSLLRTSDKKNITAEKIEALQRVQFKDLPLAGAIVRKTGSGERKAVIFADPNCGYCKKFEKETANVPNLTTYTVLIPILSQDSVSKAAGIWCSKDRAGSWSDWMLRGVTPAKAPPDCVVPFAGNLEFSRVHNITGTPTIFFEDGSRKTGAIPVTEFEENLKQVSLVSAKR